MNGREEIMEIRDDEMKTLLKDLRQAAPGDCPDEEDLAAYLENRLDGGAMLRISSHAVGCERCKVALCASGCEAPKKIRVPAAARKKAGELAPISQSPWEVVVKFLSGVIEVVRNTGDETRYFSPAYAGSRGAAASRGTLIAVNRRFSGLDVEIEIERVSDGIAEIKASAKNLDDGLPAKSLRANLYREGDELMSYAMSGGTAIFEKIKHGSYTMDFTRRGVKLGEIRIELKGE